MLSVSLYMLNPGLVFVVVVLAGEHINRFTYMYLRCYSIGRLQLVFLITAALLLAICRSSILIGHLLESEGVPLISQTLEATIYAILTVGDKFRLIAIGLCRTFCIFHRCLSCFLYEAGEEELESRNVRADQSNGALCDRPSRQWEIIPLRLLVRLS